MNLAAGKRAIPAIALIFAIAAACRASAQPDTESDLGKHARLMTPVPKTKTGPFAGDVAEPSHRPQDAPEVDHAKDDWPTDDFGQPLRGCDVPWDFVPRPQR